MGWILLGLVAALVVFAISLYNRLVRLKNSSEGAWSDIDVQLTISPPCPKTSPEARSWC